MNEIKSKMYKDTVDIVKFTGKYGFDESKKSDSHFLKWLNIWTLGLLGECGEAIEALEEWNLEKLHEEISDISWYSIALDLLLHRSTIQQLHITSRSVTEVLLMILESGDLEENEDDDDEEIVYNCLRGALYAALIKGLKFSEQVKKFTRDYPERGQIEDLLSGDLQYLTGYQEVVENLSGLFEFNNVGATLTEKLLKRYPKGFDPKLSVERTN